MQQFVKHSGTAAPLRRSNVDTDQIIPAEYLKRVTRAGFKDGLFSNWRKQEPDFVLNQPTHVGSSILIAGPDFGTGSSREHAVWALLDYGFRVVIAPRFGDILRLNSSKAGLLTVELPDVIVQTLWEDVEDNPQVVITVDLENMSVSWPGHVVGFEFDEYTRWQLMNGLDEIGLTLQRLKTISTYEASRNAWLPHASEEHV